MNYQYITTCDILNGTDIGVVLWVQGCDLHCKGCHNPQTWTFNDGNPFGLEAHQMLFDELHKSYIKRLTISGGHPLAPNNLTEITSLCKDVKEHFPNIKIWVYTGYIYENIKDYEIMKYIDVLVDGAYIEEKRDISLAFRGSSNQRIIDIPQTLKEQKIILL